ncbi:MAG: hypothetical protein KGI80_05570 [Verrucomicrobiota bacterium]|nr:hypothetical protein [Verrucomicrobiota bacterium]
MEAFLGDYAIPNLVSSKVDELFAQVERENLRSLPEHERRDRLNRLLCDWIEKEKTPCFLLPTVLAFIERAEKEASLLRYTFSSFELWLNQYSGLSAEKNYEIRGKIAGRWVERSSYQHLFPIGMGQIYEGVHVVTAHRSPDLDTTIASFWGWLDAFAARVGDGLHLWNVPGGPPEGQIEIEWLFRAVFGKAVFTHLAKKRTTLNVTARDLMRQEPLERVSPEQLMSSVNHARAEKAIVIAGAKGSFLGDWRGIDVEEVGQLILQVSSAVRWFEHQLIMLWISLLTKESLTAEQAGSAIETLFATSFYDSEPARHLSSRQKERVGRFFAHVVGIQEPFTFALVLQGLSQMTKVSSPLFVAQGVITAMQPLFVRQGMGEKGVILSFLEKSIEKLHQGILEMRQQMERLEVALCIKEKVFGDTPVAVSMRSDVEELRNKIGSGSLFLTVVHSGDEAAVAGVISSATLQKASLGTVSLRDFCNREEMGIPPYFDVISVVDHHKSKLQTLAPPLAVIADVQSSNTLVAFHAFQINDRYSSGGQTREAVEEQMKSAKSSSLLQRLLRRRQALSRTGGFFVDPIREMVEYFHFLYAIFDDTDLLSKVSGSDVECVVELLNRLKSLTLGQEVELFSLDDLPRDRLFPKRAAERILRHPETYSLYRKVSLFRAEEVEKSLVLSAEGKVSHFFADTKEQNGCCRIGQTKIFAGNVPTFLRLAEGLRAVWLQRAEEYSQDRKEVLLHLHMISTIAGAEEVYRGAFGGYNHKDELWIWIPEKEEVAVELLKCFLTSFQHSPGLQGNPLELECPSKSGLAAIFRESFLSIPCRERSVEHPGPIAILRFTPGSLNSRKAMVSPFLPTK